MINSAHCAAPTLAASRGLAQCAALIAPNGCSLDRSGIDPPIESGEGDDSTKARQPNRENAPKCGSEPVVQADGEEVQPARHLDGIDRKQAGVVHIV